MPVGNIFLSYRRDDTAGHAGRLFDRLNQRFPGHVFRDVSGITVGHDFVKEIERKLASCDVLIVLIGKQWLTLAGGNGRRRHIDEENDFVRLEVAAGLRRDILVIPVLVDGARMPRPDELPADLKPLANRNALEITEPDFDHDVERLMKPIKQKFGVPSQKNLLALAAVVALVIVGLAVFKNSGSRAVAPARSVASPTPSVQVTPPARPANAAAEKQTAARPTPVPTAMPPSPAQIPPALAAEVSAPLARDAADSFDPVGEWEVQRLANPNDRGTLTFNAYHEYTVSGKVNGEDISGEGTWKPGPSPGVLFLRPSGEVESYELKILGGGRGVYDAKHAYYGYVRLRRVSPR